ncbi:MAG: cupin domain-containing protein [Candidatus Paceibacterota bacterium]
MITTPYHANIEKLTIDNPNFRKVIYTGNHCQLVLMSLLPSEEIGLETHPKNDQFFRFEKGQGKAIVSGQEFELSDGTALIVPAGVEHNIVNTGPEPLRFYTLYSPAHHIDGRVHVTKFEAEKDVEDEEFGNK